MIGKICAAPKGGGSAKGAVEYILCYTNTSKGASSEEQLAGRDALYADSLLRDDMGSSSIWSPESGRGIRPSSVYAHGVSSLASAALEMQSIAASNPRVRSAATHLVISLGDGVERSDAEFISGVKDVLGKIGAADLQYVIATHRDTDNVHAHVVVGNVDPVTHMAWDRTQIYSRLSRAEREVEIELGWEHDRGLYVVRDEGLQTERVDRSTRAERKAWEGERADHAHERRRYEMYETREADFARYADASVGPRMRDAIDRDEEANVAPSWSEMHLVAERYGVRISANPKTGTLQLIELQAVDGEPNKRIDGASVDLVEHIGQEHLAKLGAFRHRDDASQDLAQAVEVDPGIVSRRISLESSTFDADDISRYIADRVADPGELERLVEHVQHTDHTLRLLSADGEQPLYTTTDIDVIEGDLQERFDAMAAARDDGFDQAQLDRAIAKVEKRDGIKFDDEQRQALALTEGSLTVIEAPAGAGKTTIMAAVTAYAALQGRDIIGLTIGQAAAERLTAESKMAAMNSALAMALERAGECVIPVNGIVVVDEAGMAESRTLAWITRTAQERGSGVILVGDTGQLQPVAAGAAMRMAIESTKEHGQYTMLRNVHRHKNAWHREANLLMSDGIHEHDESKIIDAIGILDKNKAIKLVDTRDDTIDDATKDYLAAQAEGKTALIVASDRDTVRHLNEQIRASLGLSGGNTFKTANGERELVSGDRFIFKENSKRLGVLNGTTGEVVGTGKHIVVKTDGGNLVKFSPTLYQLWDHGYATTVHSAQGATVDAVFGVIDKSASAELSYVAMTRARKSVTLYAAKSNFASVGDLAEHVADRIMLKTTSRTFDEIISRTGGPDNVVAINARARQDARNHPLRAEYERSETLRAAQRTKLVRAANTRAQGKLKALAGKPLADIIDGQKNIVKEQRRAILAASKRYAPQQFGAFVNATQGATKTKAPTQPSKEKRMSTTATATNLTPEERAKQERRKKMRLVAMQAPRFAQQGPHVRVGGSKPPKQSDAGVFKTFRPFAVRAEGRRAQEEHLADLQRNWKGQSSGALGGASQTSKAQATKPSQASVQTAKAPQSTPQVMPVQPKVRRETPITLNGKKTGVNSIPRALDSMKAAGQTKVEIGKASSAVQSKTMQGMAKRGMTLAPQSRAEHGPAMKAATAQVASKRAEQSPQAAKTLQGVQRSEKATKAKEAQPTQKAAQPAKSAGRAK